jgi:hypothetical protein
MTNELFESLLHESEGETLDFKREQYAFASATEEQKSELIKDILTMANAWRRTTAYIVVGVEEIDGRASKIVGVDHHLAEAAVQQLVNSKTNRPISFAYEASEYKGHRLGIIAVPVQERPFYLKSKYGKIQANTVYLRRGSSTAIADPDEVAKMGRARAIEIGQPSVVLAFADVSKRIMLGKVLEKESKVLVFQNRENIPNYGSDYDLSSVIERPNRNFYREYAKYLEEKFLFTPFGFVLENSGDRIAENTRLEIDIPMSSPLRFTDFPKEMPEKSGMYSVMPRVRSIFQKDELTVKQRGDGWSISAGFGSVQPKAKAWTHQFYVGAMETVRINVTARVFADNLSSPFETDLEFSISTMVAAEAVSVDKVVEWAGS